MVFRDHDLGSPCTRPGRTKTISISLHEDEVEIIEKCIADHAARGSRITRSAVIRWLIHHANLEDIPPQY